MATKVKNTGYVTNAAPISLPSYARKATFSLSNGNKLLVTADTNDSTTTVGYGERNNTSKIYIYESSDNGASWTLRQTITTASALADPVMYSCEVFTNNDIGIAYKLATGVVAYNKVTYSTWAVAAAETVYTPAGGVSVVALDIDIANSTQAPQVAVLRSSSTASGYRVITRATTGGSWVSSIDSTLGASALLAGVDISIAAVENGALLATSMTSLVVMSFQLSTDQGVMIYSGLVDHTSGTGSSWGQRLQTSAQMLITAGLTASRRRVMAVKNGGNAADIAISVNQSPTSFNPNGYGVITVGKYTGLPSGAIGTSQSFTSFFLDYIPDLGTNTMTFNQYNWNFYGASNQKNSDRSCLFVTNVRVAGGATPSIAHTKCYWTNSGSASRYEYSNFMAGGVTALPNYTHTMCYLVKVSTTAYELWTESYQTPRAPAAVGPAAGATVQTSQPALYIDADLDRAYPQYYIKASYQIASDAAFSTNLKNINIPDAWVNVEGTDVAGVVKRINNVVDAPNSLFQGTWYIRAAQYTSSYLLGAYTAAQSFTVSHPPTPTNLSPSGDSYSQFNGGSKSLSWLFTDPYAADYQTAYQVVVERNSDGLVVYDSNKVTSSNQTATATISATYKDVQLRWKVRVWDMDDVAGSYSAYQTFYVGDPAPISITSPANNSTVTTGIPTVSFTITVPAPRTLKSYRVKFTQGTTVIHDSGVINAPAGLNGAVARSYAPPQTILKNNNSYTITVTATDSVNMDAVTATAIITTSWVLPAAVTGVSLSTALFGTEGFGYNTISWSDAARDTDFQNWIVYRRISEVDPNNTSTVFEVGSWVPIATIYTVTAGGTYTFNDYYCPSAVKAEYKVTQMVNRFGDQVESPDSTIASGVPVSDGYWIVSVVDPTQSSGTAIRIANVISDSLDDEYDEQEIYLQGRGRYVDQGDYMGVRGTLGAQLRGSASKSARQQRRDLEALKASNRTMYLRNPFGDVYYISTGNFSIGRVAGVGKNEFVDLTIPYFEVGK